MSYDTLVAIAIRVYLGRNIKGGDGVTHGRVIDVHRAKRRKGVWLECLDNRGKTFCRYRGFKSLQFANNTQGKN